MTVEIDGKPGDVGTLWSGANVTLVALDKAIPAISHHTAEGDTSQPGVYRIRMNGKVVIQIPVGNGSGSGVKASIFDPTSPSRKVLRQLPVDDPPARIALPGSQARWMMDINQLANLMGVAADWDEEKLALFTPQYWCDRLGITQTEGRLYHNLRLMPEFGISPPAVDLLIWFRSTQKAYVQVYKFSSGRPEPMLGYINVGDVKKPVATLHTGVTEGTWPAEQGKSRRFTTRFTEVKEKTYGYYAILALARDVEGNPVDLINSGGLKDSEWCLVGVRQTATHSSVRYKLERLAAGQTVKGLANKYNLPESLVRSMNGLSKNEIPSASDSLVVLILNQEPKRQAAADYIVLDDMYEVQPGDTFKSLAQRWHVNARDIATVNTSIPRGAELEAGEVIYILQPKQPEPKFVAQQPTIKYEPATAVTNPSRRVAISSDARGIRRVTYLNPSTPVVAHAYSLRTGRVQVAAGDRTGYVARTDLSRITRIPVSSPRPIDPSGRYVDPTYLPTDPVEQRLALNVKREALKWVGQISYDWGGNQLRCGGGMDCSHFVKAVNDRVGRTCPEPPVHDQETEGVMVHWMTDRPIEQHGRVKRMSSGPPPSVLRIGDRIICQSKAGGEAHHIGIYIGRYGNMEHGVVHCSGGRGVNVIDFYDPYWQNTQYRYAMRDSRSRSASHYSNDRAN